MVNTLPMCRALYVVLTLSVLSVGSTVSAATVSGTVVQARLRYPREIMAGVTVRLCSAEGIVQHDADSQGQFKFTGVQAGRYYLTAFERGHLRPRSRKVNIEADDSALTVDFDVAVTDAAEVAPCDRDCSAECAQSTFHVDYFGADNGTELVGTVELVPGKYHARRYSGIDVQVYRTGDPHNVVTSARTNRQGAFKLRDLPPGEYDIRASDPRVNSVAVTDVLIPRHIRTSVQLGTLPRGYVVLHVDCMSAEI